MPLSRSAACLRSPRRRRRRRWRRRARRPRRGSSKRERRFLARPALVADNVSHRDRGSDMEILFLLVGLLFIAFGLLVLATEVRTRRGACEVRGEVVGFSTAEGGASGARYFHAVAQYVGLDGATRYLEGSVGSSSPLDSVGDAVTVLAQPDDPEKAVIKSPLSYILGAVVVLMGLASCIIFFAIFRISTFSVAGAVVVVSCGAWKLHGAIRDKPLSLAAWRDYKSRLLRPRIFTDATKGQIPWADPAALQTAVAKQKAANRFAIPFFLLAGVGLVLLGGHLRKQTEAFLERAVPAAGVAIDAVGAGRQQLVGAVPARQQAHAEHPPAPGGEQVPDRVSDDVALLGRHRQPVRRHHEQIRFRLGPRDVAAVDDDGRLRNGQRFERCVDLGMAARGRDRVRNAHLAQPFQQLGGPGERPPRLREGAEDLAMARLQPLRLRRRERPATSRETAGGNRPAALPEPRGDLQPAKGNPASSRARLQGTQVRMDRTAK